MLITRNYTHFFQGKVNDLKISEILIPRQDVLERSFQGFVQLCDVEKEGKLEGDAQRLLTVTQPTEALSMIFTQIEAALKEGGRGSFFLTGTYGTGKTHSIIALSYFQQSRDRQHMVERKWFQLENPRNGEDCLDLWN